MLPGKCWQGGCEWFGEVNHGVMEVLTYSRNARNVCCGRIKVRSVWWSLGNLQMTTGRLINVNNANQPPLFTVPLSACNLYRNNQLRYQTATQPVITPTSANHDVDLLHRLMLELTSTTVLRM
jgi:hypothetical protein